MDMDSSLDTSLSQFRDKDNLFPVDNNNYLCVHYYENNGSHSVCIDKNDIYADESWVVYSKDGRFLIQYLKYSERSETHEEPASYKVKEGTEVICDYAFSGCGKIREIIIPDSVRTIGREAFGGCNSLLSIKLPCQLEVIREKTFWGCRALSYINMPESLKRVEDNAFEFCDNLSFVFMAQNVDHIASNAFEFDEVLPINFIVPNLTKEYYSELLSGKRAEIQTIEDFNNYQKERKEKEKRWKSEERTETVISTVLYLFFMGGFLYALYLLTHCISI